MPHYYYRVRSPTGEELTGELTAGDESWARHSLEHQDLVVLELRPIEVTENDTATPAEATDFSRLPSEQATTLASYVGTTMTSGLPLEDALEMLAADARDRRLAAAARQLAAELRRGVPLEASTSNLDRSLSQPVRALLTAAVRCGNPAALFEGFAQQQVASRNADMQIRSALAYPLVILLLLIPLGVLFCTLVIPQFRDIFNEFDLELPEITFVVLRLAEDLPAVIALMFGIFLLVFFLLWIIGRRPLLHRLRGALPLVGKLWIWSGQQQLAGVLATLVNQRVPLAESVELASTLLDDRSLARACRSVGRQSESGVPIGECMARSIHFDRVLSGLVDWGEAHDLLPDALQHARIYFCERIDQHSAMVRRVIPSITLVLVSLGVVVVVIALFVPLVKLIEGLT